MERQRSGVGEFPLDASRNIEMKLTLTTNSLVSPADLEPASDFEFEQNYKPALSTKPMDTNPIMVY